MAPRTAPLSRRRAWWMVAVAGLIFLGILAIRGMWPGRFTEPVESDPTVSRTTWEVRPNDIVVYHVSANGLQGTITIRQSSWFTALLDEVWDRLQFGRPAGWGDVVVTTSETETGSLLLGIPEAVEAK